MPLRRARHAWVVLGATLATHEASAADPTKAQCIAANESAQDLRSAGKLIEARAQLAVCVAASCPGPVRQDCGARLADVDKALPTLVLIAKDASGNDVGAVRATIDGKPLGAELNGTAVPLDPGQHRVVLEAAGLPRAEKTLVLHEGEKTRREVISFAPAPAPASSAASSATHVDSAPTAPTDTDQGPTPPPDATRESTPAASPGNTQRAIALGLGGLGVVGVVVGSVFGIVAKSTYVHAINSECGGTTVCSPSGFSDVHTANDQATIATVGVIAGAALLAGGAYLYLSAPRPGKVSLGASASNGSVGLSVRGAW